MAKPAIEFFDAEAIPWSPVAEQPDAMEVGSVFELRDDRIARVRAFASPEEARAAAALGGRDL
jgi:hypothetical protein